ncbi:hypothetical protein MMC29_000567 [Sticta canariensis]|nr:hypothetical protein [Sticta canariensis]
MMTRAQERERDCSQLQAERDALQASHSSLTGELQALTNRAEEQGVVIGKLSGIAQRQRASLKALQAERADLEKRAALHSPQELSRLHHLVAELSVFKERAVADHRAREEAESQAATMKLQLQQAQNSLQTVHQQNSADEKRIQQLDAQLHEAQDACKGAPLLSLRDCDQVKAAMVDSANQSVAQLKAALNEAQTQGSEVHRQLAEAENELRDRDADEARRLKHLKEKLRAAEAALQQTKEQAAEDMHQAGAAHSRAKHLAAELQEKDDMLVFVSEEVERLKGMFTAKEQRLSADRDAAHAAADKAQREADALRLKAQQLEARCSSAAAELQVGSD